MIAESMIKIFQRPPSAIQATSQELILEELYQIIKNAVESRRKNQAISLVEASSDWEKKVIQFIYQQEIRAYSKACSLLKSIQKSRADIKTITKEEINQLL